MKKLINAVADIQNHDVRGIRIFIFKRAHHHYSNPDGFVGKTTFKNKIVCKLVAFDEIVKDAAQVADVFKTRDVFKKIMPDHLIGGV